MKRHWLGTGCASVKDIFPDCAVQYDHFFQFTMSKYDLKFPLLSQSKNPHQREGCLLAGNVPFLILGPASPPSWLKAADEIATFAKRETNLFENVPFYYKEYDGFDTQMDRVLVFHRVESVDRKPTARNKSCSKNFFLFFGAVNIRRRHEDNQSYWAMAWAWLHPYERGKGHLEKAWPLILKMFPNLYPEPPFSAAMEAFLKRVDYKSDKNKSQTLIFDLAHRRLDEYYAKVEVAKRDGSAPPQLKRTFRLHPIDFATVRKQLYDSRAIKFPAKSDEEMRFEYWVDWIVRLDPSAAQQFDAGQIIVDK